ncbi:restriction endonuclease subunit S [Nocardia brevicatena]|uniref:restriction endonuclease subunit S n=1 Tax=Nocardia brevicatena TaxID=37327 RepID=UPI0002DCA936|nr:restriction endonuclease subunit S [Nocardia brevicatena]
MSSSVGLPADWERTRLDRVATVNARIGWKALTASEYQPEGYAFLATPNIKSREIDFSNVNYISEFRYEESPELKLRSGDILLAKDGNTLGIVNIVRDLPRPATVNGSIAVIRAHSMRPEYLRYVIASDLVQGEIGALKGGMGVPHLFQWDIKRLRLSCPPMEEQRRIADFLDAETSLIDRMVDRQESLLQLLAERIRAHRDSMVNRLAAKCGEVSLRRFVTRIEQGASPQCDSNPRVDESQWAVLKLSAVKRGNFHPEENKLLPPEIEPAVPFQVRDGDLLVTRANTPNLVGDVAVVTGDCKRLLLPDLIYRVTLANGFDSRFVAEVALSGRVRAFIEASARGTSQSMVKLRGEDIRSWPLPLAGPKEQRELVTELSDSAAHTQRLCDAVNFKLRLLAERRQALITAAVTGQFDISTASGRNTTQGV